MYCKYMSFILLLQKNENVINKLVKKKLYKNSSYIHFWSGTLPIIHYNNNNANTWCCRSFYKVFILQSHLLNIKYFESKYKNFLLKKNSKIVFIPI